jgi:hypothetical protein
VCCIDRLNPPPSSGHCAQSFGIADAQPTSQRQISGPTDEALALGEANQSGAQRSSRNPYHVNPQAWRDLSMVPRGVKSEPLMKPRDDIILPPRILLARHTAYR